jgi:hypothetical protein
MQTPPRQQTSSQQIAPNAPARNRNNNNMVNSSNVINNMIQNEGIVLRIQDTIGNVHQFNFQDIPPNQFIDNSIQNNNQINNQINHLFNFHDNNIVNRQLNFNNIQ